MPVLTLGDAAKIAGVHKATLRRAIDAGTISASRDDGGAFRVDRSELSRWMDARAAAAAAPHEAPRAVVHAAGARPLAAPDATVDSVEDAASSAPFRAALAEARLADALARIEELARERDSWRAQAERLLITHQPAPMDQPRAQPIDNPPAPSGFWRRLFGG